jgi:hypothetical protein
MNWVLIRIRVPFSGGNRIRVPFSGGNRIRVPFSGGNLGTRDEPKSFIKG